MKTLSMMLLAGMLCGEMVRAENASITVKVDQPGHAVSPTLYGIFFEEINRAGDGGIYAEMIQNRSFEDPKLDLAWSLVKGVDADGAMALDKSQSLNANNPTSLRLEVKQGRVGVANHGFRHDSKGASEIAVEQGKDYSLSLYARGEMTVTVTLEKPDGTVLASAEITGIGASWKKFAAQLTPNATASDARLVIAGKSAGMVWLDMVSLFPKGQLFRADLLKMLQDMKPAFMRFPGGCYVEGDKLKDASRWKQSIGDIAERPGHWNLWGYQSNDGLGYHEYMLLCEAIGATPLFVINCGMAHKDHVPIEKMDEFVQDALDAIEYANGPTDSKWGELRAKAGHPAPFGLRYMEIGNENGGPLYAERYALFYKAIKAKYPKVQLVANVWGGLPKSAPAEIADEHYYSSPEFFMQQAAKYDKYDRAAHKVYVGEYAVTQGAGRGNLIAGIGEAAFMTGMERNSDVVVMASYAPLFEREGWRHWNPNAIQFNAARTYGTPSYHVQALFAQHRADVVLPVEVSAPKTEVASRVGRIGVGTWATQAEYKDIRVEKDGKVLLQSDFTKGMKDWKMVGGKWEVVDGALRQTSNEDGARMLAGDPKWTDYTLSLKARKLGGAEGFLILFQTQRDQEKSWWNLGGWGNHQHGLETPGVAMLQVPGKIETGRWYDIRVELKGGDIRCYLDGEMVHEAHRSGMNSLYVTAGRKQDTGEIILKVVNASTEPVETEISLPGAQKLQPTAKAWVLTSGSPTDDNSFDEPAKVAPKEIPVTKIAGQFSHSFPAYSVTVMRIQER